jgi:hypothetical protein
MSQRKIGFLFLVTDGLSQPGVWRRFLAGHEDRYSLYTLAKHPRRLGVGFLRDRLLPECIPTSHGSVYPHTGLAVGQVGLLRHALKDPAIAKFVFVSQTCAPIRGFDHAYEALTADDLSWITCEGGFWEQRYAMLPKHCGVRPQDFGTSSNWVALNRRHAEILVAAEKEWMPRFASVVAADEHYAPTVLKLAGCADQCKPYNVTHVDWSRGCPYTFDQITADDLARLSRGPHLLARKFSPSSNIAAVWDELIRMATR